MLQILHILHKLHKLHAHFMKRLGKKLLKRQKARYTHNVILVLNKQCNIQYICSYVNNIVLIIIRRIWTHNQDHMNLWKEHLLLFASANKEELPGYLKTKSLSATLLTAWQYLHCMASRLTIFQKIQMHRLCCNIA